MQKKILIVSLSLNLGLFVLIFQFRDKILARIFPPEKITILMIGDSRISQENWSILLGRNDVKNEAFGGAITQQVLWNLERGQLNSEPKIVIIECGINDLLAGVPVQRVYENYVRIIEVLRKKKIKIIISSIIYTADNQQINKNIAELNIKLSDMCKSQKIAWLDVNLYLSSDSKLLEKYSLDGVHMNKEAYLVWAKKMNEILVQFGSF
ncbi:MAG: GDSL-type esterase/lipase family protein [Arcicella sp.]|nr:GDSL-type esterase/lipase family protein [Arcicella sp.]